MGTAVPSGVEVVWFKRDLRLNDHPALHAALQTGRPVVCLYVHEPSLIACPEFDASHQVFIAQSIAELDARLRERGARMTQRVGELPDVLATLDGELRDAGGIAGLWSHEETGLGVTFERDKRVARYCRARNLPWTELPQRGVFRALKERDGWARLWRERVERAPLEAPAQVPSVAGLDPGGSPSLAALGLPPSTKPGAQPGGERAAHATLQSFLTERGEDYQRAMSSPVSGERACSRISPHLAWGTISATQVLRAVRRRQARLQGRREPAAARWRQSLEAFESRLAWRDHFTQKLESQPSLEFENMNRGFDGMRENDFSRERFEAFTAGQTGYPMIDACVRSLKTTGWLNFRMRAMLVSFASWHLWLHWRPVSVWMAPHFLDFEPGIHFPQFQMQAGTQGINTTRIYNPAKQARDQDPTGAFIRRWVPELEGLELEFLAEPHLAPPLTQRMAGCVVGRDYPTPIVAAGSAVAAAKQRLGLFRRRIETREAAADVARRHGSRRRR